MAQSCAYLGCMVALVPRCIPKMEQMSFIHYLYERIVLLCIVLCPWYPKIESRPILLCPSSLHPGVLCLLLFHPLLSSPCSFFLSASPFSSSACVSRARLFHYVSCGFHYEGESPTGKDHCHCDTQHTAAIQNCIVRSTPRESI